MQLVFERMIQGIYSAIGIGALFYCYPVVKHIFSEKYRYKFQFQDDSKIIFQIETMKYLRRGLLYGFIYGSVIDTIVGPWGAIWGI